MKLLEVHADFIAKFNEENNINNQQKNINSYRELIQFSQSQSYKFNQVEWEAIQSSIEKDAICEEQFLLPAEEWIGKFINLAEVLFEYRGKIEEFLGQLRNSVSRRRCGTVSLTKSAWDNTEVNQLVHTYDDINLNIVWNDVQQEIPILIRELSLNIPFEKLIS